MAVGEPYFGSDYHRPFEARDPEVKVMPTSVLRDKRRESQRMTTRYAEELRRRGLDATDD